MLGRNLQPVVERSWRALAADKVQLSCNEWFSIGFSGSCDSQLRQMSIVSNPENGIAFRTNSQQRIDPDCQVSTAQPLRSQRSQFRNEVIISRSFASGKEPNEESGGDTNSKKTTSPSSKKGKSAPDSEKESLDTENRPSTGFASAPTVLEAKKSYKREAALKSIKERLKFEKTMKEEEEARAARLQQRLQQESEAEFGRIEPWFNLIQSVSLKGDLRDEHLSKYVFIDTELLPEIFERESVKEEQLHPRGGCPTLEDELIHTSSEAIMYRKIIRNLTASVSGKEEKQMYLTGPANSGKSIALLSLVNQMRAQGWLVWYIPQAKQLTHGGFFFETDEGVWDTPESARMLLKHLKQGNTDRISTLKTANGKSVIQLIDQAVQQTDAKKTVDLFLEIREAVCNADDVLIAIDNYQALYRPCEYGEWLSQHHRRSLDPSELRVASSMRLLDQEPLRNGVVVCSSSRGGQFSPKLKVPLSRSALFNIPNFTLEEFQNLARFYMIQGTTEVINEETIKKCFFLLGANPKEYKIYAGAVNWD